MPLSADNIVHSNTGGTATSSTSTPIAVSLAGGDTTAADTSVVVVIYGKGLVFPAGISGWTQLVSSTSTTPMAWVRDSWVGLTAGESSWDFTPSLGTNGGPTFWVVLEIEGASSLETGFISSQVKGQVTSGTSMTVTSAALNSYDNMCLVFAGINESASTTPSSWSGWTNDYTEIISGSQVGATTALGASVAVLGNVTSPAASSTTATCSRTMNAADNGEYVGLGILAAGARFIPDLLYCDGAEHGLVTGNTLGVAGYKVLASVTAGVSASATAARSGNSGWLLASTAAACNFTQEMATGFGWPVNRRHFRFPTLPSVDTEIWVLTTTGGTNMVLRYINASQSLGMKVGTGSEVVSDQTITANQWFGVDWRADLRVTTAYRMSWAVDYDAALTDTTPAVPQTVATGSGTGTAVATTGYRIGWTNAITVTMHTDDAATARVLPHYPIGDVRVLPLKVDPGGTPTISGTSTNFGVMTANGATISAWNATNARNAVDDVPPDLSGTRDAAVAILIHATDYAEFPMETLDQTALKVNVRGIKAVGSFWAASGTVTTIRCMVHDGTTSYTVFPEADPPADNAATPAWFARMVRAASYGTQRTWTQAELDALVFRFGSNDGNPDIGVDCVLFEAAVTPAHLEDLFGAAGEPVHVQAYRDPDSQMLVGAVVTTDADNAVELTWEVDGVPDSSGSIPPSTTAQYVPLSADGDIATVGTVSLIPG